MQVRVFMRAALAATFVSLGLQMPPARAAIPRLTALFVFGDSLLDSGNVGSLTWGTFPPSPPYAPGRASNGPVAVEYLWNLFNPGDPGFLPSTQPGGTNYALYGATSGTRNNVPSFSSLGNSSQLQQFLVQSPTFDPRTSLFVVWFFPNDLLYWSANSNNTPGTIGMPFPGGNLLPALSEVMGLIDNGVSNITSTISILADQGATNFLVPNIPDLGTTPFFQSLGPAQSGAASQISALFNGKLEASLTQLQTSLFDTDIVQFQSDDLFADMRNNPADYGLTNPTDSCIDNLASMVCDPSTWLFWDGNHPTTAVHRIVGSAFYRAVLMPVPVPLPVVGALAAFGWSRRLRRRIAAGPSPQTPSAGPVDSVPVG